MKFLAVLILTILLGYLVYVFNDLLPWWTVALTSLLAAVAVPIRPGWAALAGFAGVVLLWGTLAFVISQANDGIMAGRMAEVLPLGGNKLALLAVTSLIGGLLGGLGALSGAYLRRKPA